MCILPRGACPIQVEQKGPDEQKLITCGQPHCVLTDWQIVDVENSAEDEVRHFMTAISAVVRSQGGSAVSRLWAAQIEDDLRPLVRRHRRSRRQPDGLHGLEHGGCPCPRLPRYRRCRDRGNHRLSTQGGIRAARGARLPTFLLRALVVWLVLIAVERVHGMLRALLLVPQLADFPARHVSVLTGSLLVFGVTFLFVRWIGARTQADIALYRRGRECRAHVRYPGVYALRDPTP